MARDDAYGLATCSAQTVPGAMPFVGMPSDTGDRALSNQFTKSGYPLGIMVNSDGQRFVDEGYDFRNYTYAKFGKEILKQPGGFAFQVWDSQTVKWLREEEYGGHDTDRWDRLNKNRDAPGPVAA